MPDKLVVVRELSTARTPALRSAVKEDPGLEGVESASASQKPKPGLSAPMDLRERLLWIDACPDCSYTAFPR
jgi:hypothetical protein